MGDLWELIGIVKMNYLKSKTRSVKVQGGYTSVSLPSWRYLAAEVVLSGENLGDSGSEEALNAPGCLPLKQQP